MFYIEHQRCIDFFQLEIGGITLGQKYSSACECQQTTDLFFWLCVRTRPISSGFHPLHLQPKQCYRKWAFTSILCPRTGPTCPGFSSLGLSSFFFACSLLLRKSTIYRTGYVENFYVLRAVPGKGFGWDGNTHLFQWSWCFKTQGRSARKYVGTPHCISAGCVYQVAPPDVTGMKQCSCLTISTISSSAGESQDSPGRNFNILFINLGHMFPKESSVFFMCHLIYERCHYFIS